MHFFIVSQNGGPGGGLRDPFCGEDFGGVALSGHVCRRPHPLELSCFVPTHQQSPSTQMDVPNLLRFCTVDDSERTALLQNAD